MTKKNSYEGYRSLKGGNSPSESSFSGEVEKSVKKVLPRVLEVAGVPQPLAKHGDKLSFMSGSVVLAKGLEKLSGGKKGKKRDTGPISAP